MDLQIFLRNKWPSILLHGGFGQLNAQGPSHCSTPTVLHLLGDQLLSQNEDGIVTLDAENKASLLAWNYPQDYVPACH